MRSVRCQQHAPLQPIAAEKRPRESGGCPAAPTGAIKICRHIVVTRPHTLCSLISISVGARAPQSAALPGNGAPVRLRWPSVLLLPASESSQPVGVGGALGWPLTAISGRRKAGLAIIYLSNCPNQVSGACCARPAGRWAACSAWGCQAARGATTLPILSGWRPDRLPEHARRCETLRASSRRRPSRDRLSHTRTLPRAVRGLLRTPFSRRPMEPLLQTMLQQCTSRLISLLTSMKSGARCIVAVPHRLEGMHRTCCTMMRTPLLEPSHATLAAEHHAKNLAQTWAASAPPVEPQPALA